jgi:hypothetical protein
MQMVEHSGLPAPWYIRDTGSDLTLPGKLLTFRESGPAIVLVEGEAGIGKTRLLAQVLEDVQGARRVTPLLCTLRYFVILVWTLAVWCRHDSSADPGWPLVATTAPPYSPAASAVSETWTVSGLQGNKISSSQPASVKPATVSATFCGEVRAPAAMRSAKSPVKL